MCGEKQLVGNGLVGHSFYHAGDDFLLALAQGLLLVVAGSLFFVFQQLLQPFGNDVYVVVDGKMGIIFFQRIGVNDRADHRHIFHALLSFMFCLEVFQVKPSAKRGVDNYHIGRVQLQVILQGIGRGHFNGMHIQVGQPLQHSS